MTKQDYERVANAFNFTLQNLSEFESIDDWKSSYVVKMLLNSLVVEFRLDNSKFNENRFREAVGKIK